MTVGCQALQGPKEGLSPGQDSPDCCGPRHSPTLGAANAKGQWGGGGGIATLLSVRGSRHSSGHVEFNNFTYYLHTMYTPTYYDLLPMQPRKSDWGSHTDLEASRGIYVDLWPMSMGVYNVRVPIQIPCQCTCVPKYPGSQVTEYTGQTGRLCGLWHRANSPWFRSIGFGLGLVG